jgi:hypothetical protein
MGMVLAAAGPALADDFEVGADVDRDEAVLELRWQSRADGVRFVVQGKVWGSWVEFRFGDDGPCNAWTGAWFELDDDGQGSTELTERMIQEANRYEQAWLAWVSDGNPAAIPPCDDGGPPPDPIITIVEHVRAHMPPVQPTIQPASNVLAGLPVYLQLGRPAELQPPPVTLPGLGIQVELTAEAVTVIDWGNPHADSFDNPSPMTISGTSGVAWQDRDQPGAVPITHYYTHVGDYTVTITDTWHVQFTLPGIDQVFEVTVPMPAHTFDLPVGQLQAVVTG